MLTNTSVSSMSNSTGGRGKGAASTPLGKRSSTSGGNMHSEKKKREFSPLIDDADDMAEESEREDDKDTDYIPVTDTAAMNGQLQTQNLSKNLIPQASRNMHQCNKPNQED